MVTKKIRSEYMKKFKDPKWETYTKCYEDSLRYRLTRRLLEQSHRPWFWDGCESDSESSGRSTPQEKGRAGAVKTKEETQPVSEKLPDQRGEEKQPKEAAESKAAAAEAEEPHAGLAALKTPHTGEKENESKDVRDTSKEGEPSQKEGSGAAQAEAERKDSASAPAALQQYRSRKSTRAKSQPREATDTDKENRHPFALYGSGEKQAEMAAKRTHNVLPCASTKEIHPSALRAKTRREVEKQLKTLNRRRARSADLEKAHKTKLVPDYDPWMTEYMRCFSARSR
ncbi:centriole, cilia and spindle-associated protein-like [Scleropages formosus]|uniref:Centriole, cilia and spindle-associated protein-like n=1 Tax=Scleropages formosus TaxID=113540 RepID=A0A0P7U9R8_SCLFO|nr:centriole, cilia and spindle-associated protein-like [Scleropages formosus]